MLCLTYFVSFCDTSFRFVSLLHFSFRFVVFRFVSFHFVSFHFVSQFSSTHIYHKVRNHSFVKKSRSSRFSRFFNSTDISMEKWPTSSETTIIYLQNDV